MTTKSIQFNFQIGSTYTDVDLIEFNDPTSTFGIRRTDTLAVVVAAGIALTRVSAGVYQYQFTEPEVGLNYEYWIQYQYLGNVKRIRQVLETGSSITTIPLAPTLYAQMGIDAVAFGDATLESLLQGQSNILWAMQTRRGVASDVQYQYYVQDLLTLALDHVRMQIDKDLGSASMSANGTMDALNNSTALANSNKTRASSFTESSTSSQTFTRTAARNSSSSSVLNSSNSANRSGSSYDYSTVSQSASGSSSRTQSGGSVAQGTLASDSTSGEAHSAFANGVIDNSTATAFTIPGQQSFQVFGQTVTTPIPSTVYFGTTPVPMTSSFSNGKIAAAGVGIGMSVGTSAIEHISARFLKGRINPDGTYNNNLDLSGNPPDGLFSNVAHSDSSHARSLVGSQTGAGSSVFSSSGARTNNRAASMTASSNSSTTGNASSTMTSSSHESSNRSASSSSHSESTYNSSMTASATAHRESSALDAMTATGSGDREYYSQLFKSLQQMWDDTQEVIRKLEQQMMLTQRYLANKMSTTVPNTTLTGAAATSAFPTLIQRPGLKGGSLRTPFDPWIVR